MAAASSSSQKVKTLVLVLLVLWSIVSLVLIVVWATSPDMKGSAQCRAELQEVTEKLEGAKVVWNKNKVALEELLEAERQQQEQLKEERAVLLQRLSAANSSLEECRQEQVRPSASHWQHCSMLTELVQLSFRATGANC